MARKCGMCLLLLCIGLLLASATAKAEQSEGKMLVGYSTTDVKVIPDKYNTGCIGELTPVAMDTENGTMINDILVIAASNGTRHVLDFYYRNKEIEGTIYIENYDFSQFSLWSYNEDKVDRTIKLVFNNCKFSGVVVGKAEGNISFEFNDCTIASFSGSNTIFNRCQFGGTYSDCLVPFRDIQVNDCFFSDMGSVAAVDKEVHTDGTQLYGIAGVDVEDIYYNNCRFEIPPVSIEGSTAYINACIMFQLEYSNARNVAFTDCIVNGGGYSIYARGKKPGFICDNVAFRGIHFGCANRYGIFYSDVHPDITIKDIQQTNTLYVGSVWKENGKTHLSVTNDTNQERVLQIYTDAGEYTYTIPACLTGSELVSEENLYQVTYSDLPFDIDIEIPKDCQYIVCYDHTREGYGKQIRYVNWTEEDVYLDVSIVDMLTSGGDDILSQGQCGDNITYTLTKSGVLTLSGTGNTYDFHSGKSPEWKEYIDCIETVYVEEGIEGLGSMIFRGCTALKNVSLPDSLQTIGQRAFMGCVSLTELTLPPNLQSIGKSLCVGVVLQEIYYTGENWEMIKLESGNENMDTKVVYYYNGQIYYRIHYILNDTEEESASHNNAITYTTGEAIIFTAPERIGYTFEGWYAEEACVTKMEGIGEDSSGNIYVYAKWTPNPTISIPDDDNPTEEQDATGEQVTTEGMLDDIPKDTESEDATVFELDKFCYRIIGNGMNVELLNSVKENRKSIIIPATITYKGKKYNVTSIAKNAFKNNTYVKKVIIGNNIKTIGSNAFYGCKKLKTVKMGKRVTDIGNKAFYKCTSLTAVTIPSKVKKIGKSAFEGCKKLKTITIKTKLLKSKQVGKRAFKGIKINATFKVPKKKIKTYKSMLHKKGASKKVNFKKI